MDALGCFVNRPSPARWSAAITRSDGPVRDSLRARVRDSSDERGVQAVVFALVAATFLTVYVTQPVLPILRAEFGVTPGIASLTVSAVRARHRAREPPVRRACRPLPGPPHRRGRRRGRNHRQRDLRADAFDRRADRRRGSCRDCSSPR